MAAAFIPKIFWNDLGFCFNFMKNLYLRFKRMFILLFSKEYVLIANKGNDKFEIAHNCHCISCVTDFVDQALGVLIEIEEEELDQADAVDLANRIINNKN